MYGDNWEEKPSTTPGSPQLALPDDFRELYPALARCLTGCYGDKATKRPDVPPATLFLAASPLGILVTISPRDYPQVATVTALGVPTDLLRVLDDALAADNVTWKERWKAPTRRS